MEEKGRALTSVKQLLHARQRTGHFKCRCVVVMEEVMGRPGTVTQVSRTKCSMGTEQYMAEGLWAWGARGRVGRQARK